MIHLKALDWACIIFLCSAAFVWISGGDVSLKTLAGGAIAAVAGGAALYWQETRE